MEANKDSIWQLLYRDTHRLRLTPTHTHRRACTHTQMHGVYWLLGAAWDNKKHNKVVFIMRNNS